MRPSLKTRVLGKLFPFFIAVIAVGAFAYSNHAPSNHPFPLRDPSPVANLVANPENLMACRSDAEHAAPASSETCELPKMPSFK